MSKGFFIDKGNKPTTRQIREAVGTRRPDWEDLCSYLSEDFQARSELTFCGKNFGWAMRFRRGGKALVSLYPDKGAFTVQIVLAESAVQKAHTLKLGKNVKEVLENAHLYPEGRWLFIRVKSRKDLLDVRQLIALKAGREPQERQEAR
jgi:hypothetical protein